MKAIISQTKKILIMAAICTQGIGLAEPHMFYISASPGSSDTHYERSDFNTTSSQAPQSGTVDSTGFGWRAAAGYQFNPYVATEAGYTYFGTAHGNSLAYNNGETGVSGDIKEYAADITAKAIWPIADQVNPYLDLGAAYIHSNLKLSDGFSQTESKYAPRYGTGIDFNITNHFATGISWNRINGTSSIPSADLLSVNFNYSF
jgi:outer membrane autotransporter protein